jgi:hypothetical protein
MPHKPPFLDGANQRDVVYSIAGSPPLGVAQQDTHHVLGQPWWAPARGSDSPRSVHAQVRVQGQVRARSKQDVFAACDHFAHRLAAQIRSRVLRHPKVELGQLSTGERLM